MSNDVVIAILAKDKAFALPFYLKCIYNQIYSKKNIHLYIRTNDNNDLTVEILKQFIQDYGNEYGSVYFDESNISDSLKIYGHHEWNAERFKILGKIRQESINYAFSLNAHYFVVDCDNFITPLTLKQLVKNSHNGVISPMLVSDSCYSNYHNKIDENGYMKQDELYYKILNKDIKGIIEVPVVHCTYFIHKTFLKHISYSDETNRHEYVIFSNVLRKKQIKQYLDNQEFYGFLEFASTSEYIRKKYNNNWNSVISKNFKLNANSKKTMIIAPNAGFCNRIRTMVSAIYLAEKLNMNIEHLWIGTKYRCSNPNIQKAHDKTFEHFFKESIKRCDYKTIANEVNRVYTEWLPCNNPYAWYNFQSYGQNLIKPTVVSGLDLVNEQMDASENFLIETSYINNLTITKEDKYKIYNKYFTPRDHFLDRITNLNEIDENTIGIHIIKGEFEDEIIKRWLTSIDNKVLLFSDDKQYIEEMRTFLKTPFIPIIPSINDDNDYLEFLLLSKCKVIYGTDKSLFAEEASYFGGCEYIPLTQDLFDNV